MNTGIDSENMLWWKIVLVSVLISLVLCWSARNQSCLAKLTVPWSGQCKCDNTSLASGGHIARDYPHLPSSPFTGIRNRSTSIKSMVFLMRFQASPLLVGTWWKGKEEKYIFCLASEWHYSSFSGCVCPPCAPVSPSDTGWASSVSAHGTCDGLGPLARPGASSDATTDAPLRVLTLASQPRPGGGSYIYSRPGGNSFSWSLEAVLSRPVMRPLACILGDYHQWPWPAPAWPWPRVWLAPAVSARLSSHSMARDKNEPRQMLVQAMGHMLGHESPGELTYWHLQSI